MPTITTLQCHRIIYPIILYNLKKKIVSCISSHITEVQSGARKTGPPSRSPTWA